MTRFYDTCKSQWGPGPWQDEPDELHFMTSTEHLALIHRGALGQLNGYVVVPAGHPLYGRGTWDEDIADLAVVHGITWAGPDPDEEQSAAPQWFIGFSCADVYDYQPALEAYTRQLRADMPEFRARHDRLEKIGEEFNLGPRPQYRTLADVIKEVEQLAANIAAYEATAKT